MPPNFTSNSATAEELPAGIDLFFPGTDPAPGCFPELPLLPNYLVMLKAYENAVFCGRRGGKTERRKKRENAVKPGRTPGWVITFFGVVFSPHSLWSIFEAFCRNCTKNMKNIIIIFFYIF